MEEEPVQPQGGTQSDFIQNELNFEVDTKDPLTKAALNDHPLNDHPLNDHPLNEWMDILGSGELKKKVLTPGQNGTRPNRSDICVLKLTGKLEDGTTVDEYENLEIQLGDVEVVQGLDLAVALMDIGEVAEVEVASRFGYGDIGRKPDIPPGATILYTVELLSSNLEPEIQTLSVNERKVIGDKKRERGNWWFARDESTLAIQCYRKALNILSSTEGNVGSENNAEESASDAELQALLEDRMKVYNNLAAAQMKSQAYEAALKSVDRVLSCQPQNVKALFRKGRILHCKGDHGQAYAVLLQAAKLEPDTKAIRAELAILKEKNAKDAQHEKNLYRKMLGLNQNNSVNGKDAKKEGKAKTTRTYLWSLVGGATAAAIGVLVYRFAS